MRTLKLALAALVAALFTLPATAQAQANKAQMHHVDGKPGFDAALERHMEWRADQGDPWGWHVYQVVQGKHAGDYVVRSGGHSWSDFDSYRSGFGQEAGDHFGAHVAPLIEKHKNYIEAVDTATVRWPEAMDDPALIEVTTYELKPGMAEQWWSAAEKFHEAIVQEDAEGYHYALTYPEAGSGGWARVVSPHENWADFEDPPRSFEELMTAVHGEEEAQQIFEDFSSATSSFHTMVLRYRPDLSIEASGGEGDM